MGKEERFINKPMYTDKVKNIVRDLDKSCYSMPWPLHQEVKNYVQDLLNKDLITKSCSSYSSPVVVGRMLRLRCDYRILNKKAVVDRHPQPRM